MAPLAATMDWWNSRPYFVPFFGAIPPYRYFKENKSRLYVLDVKNQKVTVNGEVYNVHGLTEEKVSVLKLIAQAHLSYWQLSKRIRRTKRIPAVAYAITTSYTDGLWKDLLYAHTSVHLDSEWNSVDDVTRTKRFTLTFPSHYTGAINEYIVRDHRFTDHGASFTARTIQQYIRYV